MQRIASRLAVRPAQLPTLKLAPMRNFSAEQTPLNTNWKWGAFAAAGVASMVTLWSMQEETQAEDVPVEGIPGTRRERTFIAIKPDGVERGLIADIIGRFEKKGYTLVALKLVHPTREHIAEHYADLSKKPFYNSLVNFVSSGISSIFILPLTQGPMVCMVWEGSGVIRGGRMLLGETDPKASLPGSIRGDMSIDLGRNICHGSDSPEGAKHEIELWWKPEEIVDWTPSRLQHIYEKV